jgi:hypothetical protein
MSKPLIACLLLALPQLSVAAEPTMELEMGAFTSDVPGDLAGPVLTGRTDLGPRGPRTDPTEAGRQRRF